MEGGTISVWKRYMKKDKTHKKYMLSQKIETQ